MLIKNSQLSRVARLLNEFLMLYDWVKNHTHFLLENCFEEVCGVKEFREFFRYTFWWHKFWKFHFGSRCFETHSIKISQIWLEKAQKQNKCQKIISNFFFLSNFSIDVAKCKKDLMMKPTSIPPNKYFRLVI